MVSLTEIIKLVVVLLAIGIALVLGAITAAASIALTPFLIAGMAHLLGYISMGTVEAVVLWFAIPGAIIGMLKVVGILVMLDSP